MAAGKSVSKGRTLGNQLGEVARHLRMVQSAVAVSVAALKQQNCELDLDIATVLQRSVVDRIEDQIERLESLQRMAASLGRRG